MLKLCLSTLLSFYATLSLAFGPCDDDIEKFCSQDGNAGETVKTCLFNNVEKLGKECAAYVKSKEGDYKKRQASLDKMRQACQKEIEANCPESLKSDKPLTVCLMSVNESLSAGCRTDVNRHIKEYLPHIKALEAPKVEGNTKK